MTNGAIKVIGVILGIILGLALIFGFNALLALFVSWAFGFVFGIDVGFWQAFIGLFLVSIVSNAIFGGLRVKLNGRGGE